MDGHSGFTQSYWMASAQTPQFAPLETDMDGLDVCIIGAGIAGLTTAYLLCKEGKRVVVLDDGPIAGGETERTTAHLSNVIDDRYSEIIRMHGEEKARLAFQSHTKAVDMIESIVQMEDIACDFKRLDAYLFLGENQHKNLIEKEFQAAHKVGFSNIELVERLPFGLQRTAIHFQRQGQFHILKYISGLCRSIKSLGGLIHSFEHVDEIHDGTWAKVKTRSGKSIRARKVVVATNSPVSDSVTLHTKQAAYRTYVIGARIKIGALPTALYWDMEDPYHYIRLQPLESVSHELLILGGEDHRTGEKNDAEQRFMNLEKWLNMHFPYFESVDYRWSGQVYEPQDGLAFIGRDIGKENIFIATGDSGMGMTHGTISGMILTDLIAERDNPWAALYDPERKPFGAPLEFAKENINSLAQYAKRLMPGEARSPRDIPPGEGALIGRGVEQVAVYKDLDGNVHEFGSCCKHLGATVSWNACEKSWDCAAHGSRYDAQGQVIDGPANSNLDEMNKGKEGREAA